MCILCQSCGKETDDANRKLIQLNLSGRTLRVAGLTTVALAAVRSLQFHDNHLASLRHFGSFALSAVATAVADL